MTAQEIFDKVWHHMAAQKVQSLSETGRCAYRGKGGTACAVGCLLSDKVAHKFDERDDASIDDIAHNCKSMIPKKLINHIELLNRLQVAHDNYADARKWSLKIFQKRAREVANEFGLTVPEVTQ